MSKEFDVNSKVNFPHGIVSKDIDGYHILIGSVKILSQIHFIRQ